jgi:hypothetical protein
MSRYDPAAIAFLQSRANHYRGLAERQTDEKLAEHYRHLAGIYDQKPKGCRQSDQSPKPPSGMAEARIEMAPDFASGSIRPTITQPHAYPPRRLLRHRY